MSETPHRRALLLGLPALAVGCAPRAARQDALVYSLDKEVIALRYQIELLQQQLETCSSASAPPPAIYTDLNQILPDLGVKVWREQSLVKLRVPVDKLFASGSMRVRAEADPIMDLLATALRLHEGVIAAVVGHSDDEPVRGRMAKLYPSNWELSTARAVAVVRSLVEEWGVGPQRLTPSGQAEWHPIAENDTPEGRAQNRRVEIILRESKEESS